MKSAFVGGATGLTGRSVVAKAGAHEVGAIAHVRPDSPKLAEWRATFAKQGASVDVTEWGEEPIRATFARLRPALCFGCLGTTRGRAKEASRAGRDPEKESYDAVDVALTEMLIRASRASGVQRFVYLSSVGAGPGARGAYLEARTRVEETLKKSGVPYTIARPSFIVGDREEARASEGRFGAIADVGLRAIGALGGGRTRDRYRSITGEDLAIALLRMANDPAWENRIAHGEDLQSIIASRRGAAR
jgi:nucleoside-diphosphate-sugar epimerase